MTQLPDIKPPIRGRILPKSTIPPEELARREAERIELGDRCRVFFDRVRDELIEQYHNWLIAIESENGDYLIDQELDGLIQKVQSCYPKSDRQWTIFRLNETGACGRI